MKIIRVFGIVVGIHLFALMLIFANPGCSSTSKPAPAAAETVAAPAPSAPVVTVPMSGSSEPSSLTPAPMGFDPTAPAVASVRYTPTRPNTPAASALEAAPAPDVTPASTYTIVAGDSLWTIAKKNHLSVGDLATANNMKAGSALRPGQKLIIPGKAPSAAAPATTTSAKSTVKVTDSSAAPKASGDSIQHTVKTGEVLGTIARKYGVKSGDIAVANNITDPKKIVPGQILTIPGWQTPKGKASAATTTPTTAVESTPTMKSVETAKPLFVIPPIEQDLDAGLKATPAGEVPVIKVEEAPSPKK